MDIAEWLRTLDLEQYAAVFRQNEIDHEVLRRLRQADRGECHSNANDCVRTTSH